MTYLLSVAAAVIALASVIELLRRRRLRERHAIWWILAATLALFAALFPASVAWIASVVGVGLPSNLVFFVSIVLLFLVNLQHSAELTDLEDKTRTLAEESALQKVRLERLEERIDPKRDLPDARP
ncbi:DUF2304 family protein [Agromyces sp. NPDC058104]|uniref:DUF2304 family protein n=1 Tax=Agromyces sp. NPDC058104 TaxID=3346342 RepID=UPI0036DD9D14